MMDSDKVTRPVGVFDSGIGGFSVLRHMQSLLPHESFVYLADQAHVPYGSRSVAELVQLSRAITQLLLSQAVKMVVIPCNTASAAALSQLRQDFPEVPFVGMEPAVKPAGQTTKSGKVGVLATAGTIKSERYGRLMQQFGQNIEVWEDPCPGLVDLIEAGQESSFETETYLRNRLEPWLAQGIDTLVLGCTHYPFIRQLLEKIVGNQMTIIDPAPAVARQAQRVLAQLHLFSLPSADHSYRFITSGNAANFSRQIQKFLLFTPLVETAVWQNGQLNLLNPK